MSHFQIANLDFQALDRIFNLALEPKDFKLGPKHSGIISKVVLIFKYFDMLVFNQMDDSLEHDSPCINGTTNIGVEFISIPNGIKK